MDKIFLLLGFLSWNVRHWILNYQNSIKMRILIFVGELFSIFSNETLKDNK